MKPRQQNTQSDKEATEALHALLTRCSSYKEEVNIVLASVVNGNITYRWLPLRKARDQSRHRKESQTVHSAATRFAGVLKGGLRKLKALDDGAAPNLCPHTATSVPAPGQLEYVDLRSEEASHVRQRLAPLAKGTFFANFDGSPDFLKHLRFYAISTVVDGRSLSSLRILSPKMELGRSRRFAVIGDAKGGAYDLLNDKALLFDDGVDCLLWGHWLYILHRTQFQQIFDYYEVLEQKKDMALEVLESLGVIDDFVQFRENARDIARWTKLARMADGDLIQQACAQPEEAAGTAPLPKPTLPEGFWERAEEVIQMFNLQVRVVGSEDDKRFLYEAKDPWQLLHLLDDDYLVSALAPQPTNNGYLAMHKQPNPLTFPVEVRRAVAPAASQSHMSIVTGRKGPRRSPRSREVVKERTRMGS